MNNPTNLSGKNGKSIHFMKSFRSELEVFVFYIKFELYISITETILTFLLWQKKYCLKARKGCQVPWETRLEFEMLFKSEINKVKLINKENPMIRKHRSNMSTQNEELKYRSKHRRKVCGLH